jgi:hypothetical protein
MKPYAAPPVIVFSLPAPINDTVDTLLPPLEIVLASPPAIEDTFSQTSFPSPPRTALSSPAETFPTPPPMNDPDPIALQVGALCGLRTAPPGTCAAADCPPAGSAPAARVALEPPSAHATQSAPHRHADIASSKERNRIRTSRAEARRCETLVSYGAMAGSGRRSGFARRRLLRLPREPPGRGPRRSSQSRPVRRGGSAPRSQPRNPLLETEKPRRSAV